MFRDVPDLSMRKMFGGLGIYSEGRIFAVLGPDEALLIKARGALAETLAAEGATQWVYAGKSGKRSTMPYWTLPEDALDDPEAACDWARRALAELDGAPI
nr:TfoX/Sxy family protein [Marivita sp. GX14005]